MTGDHSLNFDYLCLTCKGKCHFIQNSIGTTEEFTLSNESYMNGPLGFSECISKNQYPTISNQTIHNLNQTAKLFCQPTSGSSPFYCKHDFFAKRRDAAMCAIWGDPCDQNKYTKITVKPMKLTTPFAKKNSNRWRLLSLQLSARVFLQY